MQIEAVKAAYRRYARIYDTVFGPVLQPGRRALLEALNLKPGDRVLEVGGKPVRTFGEIASALRGRADQPIVFKIERDGKPFDLTITPMRVDGAGEGALIGINSVVMNGARIGAHSLIGANTLIAEGKEIPEGVLVLGSPGKIVRELKQQEKDFLLQIAQGYIDRARFYRENLKPM